jgi:hypothetical protein
MRLLIVDYLASLKEREELDAILPDLLTELGYNVISRPRRGTQQRGVDIAAVRNVGGDEVLYLFSLKAGNLSRNEWNGPQDQALRPSLDEIRDSYITSRVPPKYRDAKVVICLCFGGEIREDIRDIVAGYMKTNTTERVSYEEWNGGRLADLLLEGLLREQVLPEAMQSSFRKAVALVDEPDVAYQHFQTVAHQLLTAGRASAKARVLSVRQLSLCTWILFVWARGAGNVEAAYRAAELALLYAWDLRRGVAKPMSKEGKAVTQAIGQIADLHVRIAAELLEAKIFPAVTITDGVSSAISSSSAIDLNLALFDLLGRIGLYGVWLHFMSLNAEAKVKAAFEAQRLRALGAGFAMINNNAGLLLPVRDEQAIDIAIFLQLALLCDIDGGPVREWFEHLANRLNYTLRTRAQYPLTSSDYRDLVEHPRGTSDDAFQEMTKASTLIPTVALWARPLGLTGELEALSETVASDMTHCTMQLWSPDQDSEAHLYVNDANHGYAITDLPIDKEGSALFEIVNSAADRVAEHLNGLSAVKSGFWPIVLVACRHYRLPVPPSFWIKPLAVEPDGEAAAGDAMPAPPAEESGLPSV